VSGVPAHASIGWRLLDTARLEALTVLDAPFDGSRGQPHSAHYEWDVVHERVK
jgi:hypothetical protein